MEMDTDSAYIMAPKAHMELLIGPDMKETYYAEYGNWFLQIACFEHITEDLWIQLGGGTRVQRDYSKYITKNDKRIPVLFKDEFRVIGMAALNSKTYYC